ILLSFLLTIRLPPSSTLFPYTTLFRSLTPSPSLRRSYHAAASTTSSSASGRTTRRQVIGLSASVCEPSTLRAVSTNQDQRDGLRSEEHTSELQSRGHLVCRLLLEKKKN